MGGQELWAAMTTIRAAGPADAEQLARLNQFVQTLHLQQRPDHFRITQVPELAAWYRGLLGQSTTRAWVACVGDAPVGYVLAIIQHAPETPFTKPRAWLEVDQLAVDPDFRRQGIGRALVREAVAEAKARGLSRIEAASWSFNADTHEVFRRLGFAPRTVRFERTEQS